jgi:glycosyltransferase involved in cell wall biosynthesis
MSENHPLVSILLSVHNGEATLDRCFDSIRKQTFRDFSLTCIDDGSTDSTFFILTRWQQIFGKERFEILKNDENIGLTRSLALGLHCIDSPYTARIDADDEWFPEKLERQISFLEKNPGYGIVGCFYINKTWKREQTVSLPETDALLKKLLFYRNPFAHSCVIFRTDLIKKVGGYDTHIRYGQDYELWLRISSHTKFANIPEVLCLRNAEYGISHQKQTEQMWQYLKTQYRYLRKLKRPIREYRFMIEPLLTILVPRKIREWKRKHLL